MRADVEKIFNAFLTQVFATKKPGILTMLNDHPTKTKCIDNLCAQVLMAEKAGIKLDADKFSNLVKGVAKFWAHTALTAKEQSLVSAIEKNRIRAKNEREKDLMSDIADIQKEALNGMSKEELTAHVRKQKGDDLADVEVFS